MATVALQASQGSGMQEHAPFRRDPHFVEQVLRAVRVALHWYAPDVRGMDRMCHDDPFLVVGNHSGGAVMPDMWIFLDAWVHEHGVEREAYSLAYDLLFRPPGMRPFLERLGVL